MPDFGTVYREAQGRILSLVNNQNAGIPVPACPGWTVKDVIGRLAGMVEDVRGGNIGDGTMEEWGDTLVERSRERSLGDISSGWHVFANTNPRLFAGEYGEPLVADIVSHEFDIRGALGNREGRLHPSVRTTALFFLRGVDYAIRQDGLPALRIQVEDKVFTLGDGEPAGSITVTWYELMRMLAGRRSAAQVLALSWEGKPETWLEALFVLGLAERDIVE